MGINPENISRQIPFDEALKFVEVKTADVKQTTTTSNDQIQKTLSQIPESAPTAIQQQTKPETAKSDAPTFTQKALANLAIGSGVVLMGAGAAAGILLAPITIPGGALLGSLGVGAGKIAKDANLAKNEDKAIMTGIIVGTLGTAGMVALGAKLTTIGLEKKGGFAAQKAEKRDVSSETAKIERLEINSDYTGEKAISNQLYKFRTLLQEGKASKEKILKEFNALEENKQSLSGDLSTEFKRDYDNTKETLFETDILIGRRANEGKIKGSLDENTYQAVIAEPFVKLTNNGSNAEESFTNRIFNFREDLRKGTQSTMDSLVREAKLTGQLKEDLKEGKISEDFAQRALKEIKKFDVDLEIGRESKEKQIDEQIPLILANHNRYAAFYEFLVNAGISQFSPSAGATLETLGMAELHNNAPNELLASGLKDTKVSVQERFMKIDDFLVKAIEIEGAKAQLNRMKDQLIEGKSEGQKKEIKDAFKILEKHLDVSLNISERHTDEEATAAYTIIQRYFNESTGTKKNIQEEKVTNSQSKVDREIDDMLKELEDSETEIMNDYAKGQKNIQEEPDLDKELEDLDKIVSDLNAKKAENAASAPDTYGKGERLARIQAERQKDAELTELEGLIKGMADQNKIGSNLSKQKNELEELKKQEKQLAAEINKMEKVDKDLENKMKADAAAQRQIEAEIEALENELKAKDNSS